MMQALFRLAGSRSAQWMLVATSLRKSQTLLDSKLPFQPPAAPCNYARGFSTCMTVSVLHKSCICEQQLLTVLRNCVSRCM